MNNVEFIIWAIIILILVGLFCYAFFIVYVNFFLLIKSNKKNNQAHNQNLEITYHES